MDKRICRIEEIVFGNRESVHIKPFNLENKIKELATNAHISPNELNNVFLIDSDGVNLIALIEGKNEAEKQLKATLSILTAYSYIFETEEIAASDLKEKLRKLGISSIDNISTNLSNYRRFILQVGKGGSQKFKYKLTVPGKQEGLKLIRKFAGKVNGD